MDDRSGFAGGQRTNGQPRRRRSEFGIENASALNPHHARRSMLNPYYRTIVKNISLEYFAAFHHTREVTAGFAKQLQQYRSP